MKALVKSIEDLFRALSGTLTTDEEHHWQAIDDTRIRLVKNRFKNSTSDASTLAQDPSGDLTKRFLSRKDDRQEISKRWRKNSGEIQIDFSQYIQDMG